MTVRVGCGLPFSVASGGLEAQRVAVAQAADAGIDHLMVGDHVSFIFGIGFDGLVNATSLLSLHPTMPVSVGVYLLPLRHPVLVARQLSTIASLAPGRLEFGIGVGGEDRHEIEVCGVDPATRGRRTDEALEVLRPLLTGHAVTYEGEFFQLDAAMILPAPDPPVPIIVGGRSAAAVRRAARFGDGWMAIWVSPDRFSSVLKEIDEVAAAVGRDHPPRHHVLQAWCGFGATRDQAREILAPQMQAMYQLPFEKFEKYSPYGSPEDVAEAIAPYVEAGAVSINLIAQGPDAETIFAGVAEVKRLLNAGR